MLQHTGFALEDAFDAIPDGFMVIDDNYSVLYWNKAAREICGSDLTGTHSEWATNMGVYDKEGGEIICTNQLPIVRALRGEEVKEEVLFIKNAALDSGRYISCSGHSFRNGKEIAGAFLSFRDVTKYLQKEKEVSEERSFYNQILNLIPAFIYSKDLKGSYTFLNERFTSFQKVFGCKTLSEFLTEDLKKGISEADQKVLAQKEVITTEEEYFNLESGQKLTFKIRRFPMINNNNEIYGISGIAFDITNEVEQKAALEIERNKMIAASKLAALGMLAAEIGHEINNPLALIRTSSWILRKAIDSKKYPDSFLYTKLDEIDSTVARIGEIVSSLRNLSRDGQNETVNEVAISEILRDVNSLFQQKLKPLGIRFDFESDNHLLQQEVRCNRIQLAEVLINLLNNAADAAQGSPRPWVKLDVLKTQGYFIFRITDCGPGVPCELEKKIFAPFFSTKEFGKGTGLGLSISYDIMKRLGGNLLLNRKISPSCFECHIPIPV